MEFLYFINGIMFIGVLYGVFHAKNIKSLNEKLIEQNQLIKNQTTIKYTEIQESVGDVIDLVARIEDEMVKDQYANFSQTNKKMEELETKVTQLLNSLTQLTKESQDNIGKAFSEISQIKTIIKAIQQGALQNRY